MSRRRFVFLGGLALVSGFLVGGIGRPATAAAAGTLNGSVVPTCTTSSSVTLGGVCEDMTQPTVPFTDTGQDVTGGPFGAFFHFLFTQLFRLVTDNIQVLIIWLAIWLTFKVFYYLGKKSGAADDDTARTWKSGDDPYV